MLEYLFVKKKIKNKFYVIFGNDCIFFMYKKIETTFKICKKITNYKCAEIFQHAHLFPLHDEQSLMPVG